MLRLKSIIILIITIFSFITPFAIMPFANASNVAHAQTNTTYTIPFQGEFTQNNFLLVQLKSGIYNLIVTTVSGSTLYVDIFNYSTSGQVTGLYQQIAESLYNQYGGASALVYAGDNIIYVGAVSVPANNVLAFYIYEINLTSMGTTLYSSWVSNIAGIDNTLAPDYAFFYPAMTISNGIPYFILAEYEQEYYAEHTYYSIIVYNSPSRYTVLPTGYFYDLYIGGVSTGVNLYDVYVIAVTQSGYLSTFYYNFTANSLTELEIYGLPYSPLLYSESVSFTGDFGVNGGSATVKTTLYYGFGIEEPFVAYVGSPFTLIYPNTNKSQDYTTFYIASGSSGSANTYIYDEEIGITVNYISSIKKADLSFQSYVVSPVYYYGGHEISIVTFYPQSVNNLLQTNIINMSSEQYTTSSTTVTVGMPVFTIGNTLIVVQVTNANNGNQGNIVVYGGASVNSGVTIGLTGTSGNLANVTQITPTPVTNSSSPTSINVYYITSTMRFMLPLIFILLPAIILMVYLGTKGFIGGLSLGMVIGVYAGFIPIWALVFLGIVMLFLIFWRNGERGDIT